MRDMTRLIGMLTAALLFLSLFGCVRPDAPSGESAADSAGETVTSSESKAASGSGALSSRPSVGTTTAPRQTASASGGAVSTGGSSKQTVFETRTTAGKDRYGRMEYMFKKLGGYYTAFGRSVPTETGISVDWTASGVEFTADCEGDVFLRVFNENSADVYFTVWVDGVRSNERFSILNTAYSADLKIASGLKRGRHVLRILRQTEAPTRPISFVAVSLCGQLLPAEREKKQRIEFIGDSITAGYGDLLNKQVTGNNDEGTSLWEDGTRTYAFKTAEKLNADISVVAVSGIGLVCGEITAPQIYPYANYYRDAHVLRDSGDRADIVVVNLGTNDDVNHIDPAAFVKAAEAFVGAIRRQSPDATLIWAFGMMSSQYQEEIAALFEKMGGADSRLYVVTLPEGRSGGHWHPNESEHEAAAEVLSNFIRSLAK